MCTVSSHEIMWPKDLQAQIKTPFFFGDGEQRGTFDANVFFLSFFVSEVIETGTLQTLVMTSVIIEQGCLFDCWDKHVLQEMYEFNLQSCEAGCRPKAKAMQACFGVQVSLISSDPELCSLLLFWGVEFESGFFFWSQYESVCSEVMKDTAVLSKVTT